MVASPILDELVKWISEGKTLRSFCRQDGYPCKSTIYEMIDKAEGYSGPDGLIARARDLGYDEIAEECLEIIDSADDANLGKAQVWTRLQLLAKWNPKKYGDKITHQGDESAPLVVRHIGKPSE
jgi:hypothetical protein